MQRDMLLAKLSQALMPLGLDLSRYTDTLLDSFLHRFPDPDGWSRPEARDGLIGTFAIGETTFLRDREHFHRLAQLTPTLVEHAGGRPLRVLSLGCASGEEVYSLVATLRAATAARFEVIGWDLNREFIARARRGEYRPWSLRGVTAHDTRDFLRPAPSGVKVDSWLSPFVRFEVANLCSDPLPSDVDVIFCRNVLLYFRRDQAQLALSRMAQALAPHGVLFLGHHDPRPAPETGLGELFHGGVSWFMRAPRGPAPCPIDESRAVLERPIGSIPVSLVRRPPENESPERALERVRNLARQGRLVEAEPALDALLTQCPLYVDAHVLNAVIAEERGNVRRMVESARRACFLAPDAPGPNYYMSVSFMRSGELRRAALHRRISASLLARENTLATVVPHSEGLTVSQLRRLVGAVTR